MKESFTKDVTVFQVPHHGSNESSFVPHDIRRNLDENDPLLELKINIKPSGYKEALFYREIQAKTYFISFGDRKDHPHSDVITY